MATRSTSRRWIGALQAGIAAGVFLVTSPAATLALDRGCAHHAVSDEQPAGHHADDEPTLPCTCNDDCQKAQDLAAPAADAPSRADDPAWIVVDVASVAFDGARLPYLLPFATGPPR